MSEIRATTISNVAGTGPITLTGQSAAKVWVQHTDTAVNNASLGISSIVDDAVGINTLNFSNAFSDSNFATTGMSQTGSDRVVTASSPTTTSAVIETFNTAGSNVGSTSNQAIFGDLA